MGWSSWSAFATNIDEDKILGSAQRTIDSGLAAKGYRYINIDDGWALKGRQPDGHMIVHADKFLSARTGDTPSFKPFTDRLHKTHGVTFAVYGDGKLLGTNPVLRWGMAARRPSLPVAGVKLIELVARSPGGDNQRLPVIWGKAALMER